MDKKYFQFGTPRSGSSLVYRYMFNFFTTLCGYEKFDGLEFFNRNYKITDSENGLIKSKYLDRINRISKQENLEKITLLEKYKKEKYFLSAHSWQINQEIFDYLNDNYHFILIERRDILDQVLSLSLARQTGQWNFEKPITNYPKYKCEYIHYQEIKYNIEKYIWYKKQIKNIHCIMYYEDFEKHSHKIKKLSKFPEFTFKTGLKQSILYGLPNKQINKEEKLKLLLNKEEVIMWFNTNPIIGVDAAIF